MSRLSPHELISGPQTSAQHTNLLSLPFEIRHKIWLHCLTNLHIHIDEQGNDQTPPISRSLIDGSSSKTSFKPDVVIDLRRATSKQVHGFTHSLLLTSESPPHSDTFGYVLRSMPTRLPQKSLASQQLPAIWRVCKQLHDETHLLSYADTNVFSFASVKILETFFDRRVGGMQHIPRIWFSHHDSAAFFVSFLQPENGVAKLPIQDGKGKLTPLNGLREVWISTMAEPRERDRHDDDSDEDDGGGGAPLMSFAIRIEQPIAAARLKQATEFWEARGVTVVRKSW